MDADAAGPAPRRGEHDHTSGAVTLREWVETRWLPAQDLEPQTIRTYNNHLRQRIFPTFGDRPVNTLVGAEEIAIWDKQLRSGFAHNTAQGARTLLTTILEDAVGAGMLKKNASRRRRYRGKVAERRQARTQTRREWLTPFQVLLLAERLAAVSGRDRDFVLAVTAAWCGLRWGEVMAVHTKAIRGGTLIIDSQLVDLGSGPLLRSHPKDGSFRNGHPSFFGALDLPPFLRDLLARQAARRPALRCGCGGSCGGDAFLFLDDSGAHLRHSEYLESPWEQACEAKTFTGRRGQGRPVLVNMTPGWPGQVLTPSWPAAAGPDWSPPRGRGMPHYDLPAVDALAIPCPGQGCKAPAQAPCASRPGGRPHRTGGGCWRPGSRGM